MLSFFVIAYFVLIFRTILGLNSHKNKTKIISFCSELNFVPPKNSVVNLKSSFWYYNIVKLVSGINSIFWRQNIISTHLCERKAISMSSFSFLNTLLVNKITPHSWQCIQVSTVQKSTTSVRIICTYCRKSWLFVENDSKKFQQTFQANDFPLSNTSTVHNIVILKLRYLENIRFKTSRFGAFCHCWWNIFKK